MTVAPPKTTADEALDRHMTGMPIRDLQRYDTVGAMAELVAATQT